VLIENQVRPLERVDRLNADRRDAADAAAGLMGPRDAAVRGRNFIGAA
jgi:hypothetical protein